MIKEQYRVGEEVKKHPDFFFLHYYLPVHKIKHNISNFDIMYFEIFLL